MKDAYGNLVVMNLVKLDAMNQAIDWAEIALFRYDLFIHKDDTDTYHRIFLRMQVEHYLWSRECIA